MLMMMATPEENIIYEGLIETYGDMVYRVCVSIVKDHYAALDLTQEVFTQAYKKRATIRTDNLQGWLRKTAKNKSINYYHRNKRLQKRELSIDSYFGEALDVEDIDHAISLIQTAFSANPEQNVLFQELVQEVAIALERLDPVSCHIMLDYLNSGRPIKKIAENFGLNQQTVYTKVRRARMKIIKSIRRYLEKSTERSEGYVNANRK